MIAMQSIYNADNEDLIHLCKINFVATREMSNIMEEGSASDWLSRVGAVRLMRSGRHSKQRWQAQNSLPGKWRNFDFFRKEKLGVSSAWETFQ